MEKPTLPKGTRDFGPATMAKRQFIFNNIRKVFQKFGFQPLETPAMENLSTLTGKYGEEGDQLLFRIQDSEDFLDEKNSFVIANSGTELRIFFDAVDLKVGQNKITDYRNEERVKELEHFISELGETAKYKNEEFEKELQLSKLLLRYRKWIVDAVIDWYKRSLRISKDDNIEYLIEWYNCRNGAVSTLMSKFLQDRTSEKGLRYDLTVPFARFVVMNRNEISFPFKRYQIQPVWRADRPQKGRYREFYQCDADVVGTDSLICEADIILMIREVFLNLGITDYTIKINHRGILSGIAEIVGTKEHETSLFVAIDKLDKIGEEKVREELRAKGFEEKNLDVLFDILNFNGTTAQKIEFLNRKFKTTSGQKGIADLNEVLSLLKNYGTNDAHVEFDIALARGLSYYTGCIFEVKINNVSIGSVSGGGRYDNLTKAFGDKENLSGVGFSFGVDRLFDAMEELQIFPKEAQLSSKVFICHFDEASMRYGLNVLTKLREANISSEIYPDQAKIKKQLDYVNKKMIPYTIVIGSDEMASGSLAFKNMESGEQEKLPIDQIIQKLQ
jgi:histidyl-tRNA synthetase